ncbi:peptide-binding protein [Synergistales bacterium]|nr:peptide-binding protein [Synergistales bacterium]
MKKIFLSLFLFAACIICLGSEVSAASQNDEYITVYSAEIRTANYIKDSDHQNITLAYSTQDSIVQFDRFGFLRPGLAESWEIADDNVTYTFHLRDGATWSTWDGKIYAKVTAQDFVDSMKWVLTKENASTHSNTIYNSIKNAEEYYNGAVTDFGEVGIKALDDKTVQYVLKAPLPYFIPQISFTAFFPLNGKFMAEKGDRFGSSKENLLYSGPYLLSEFEPQQQRVLIANPNYWNKDKTTVKTLTYIYNAEASAIGPELFLRGEINDIILPGGIVDEWMSDPAKKAMIYPNALTNMTYFMAFNFEPNYEEQYAPSDWIVAVNDLNFRKSLFHALDRESAVATIDPYNPARLLVNTLTRKALVSYGGLDYTQIGGLKAYSDTESFDAKKASEYKGKALDSLKGRVSFPVKIVMPYNSSDVEKSNRAQIIEQQMEGVLGTDYIDIILVSHPATGYTAEVLHAGRYSIMEAPWGPDFVDPLGSLDPMLSWAYGPKYSRVYLAKDIQDSDGQCKFEKMVKTATAEVSDLKKRYEMFAEAETLLLDNALFIPFYMSGGGYRASYLDPFSGTTGQMGRYGAFQMKEIAILDKPVGMDGYPDAVKAYEAQRAEAAIAKN